MGLFEKLTPYLQVEFDLPGRWDGTDVRLIDALDEIDAARQRLDVRNSNPILGAPLADVLQSARLGGLRFFVELIATTARDGELRQLAQERLIPVVQSPAPRLGL